MSFLRDGLDWHGLTGRVTFALASVLVLGLMILQGRVPPLSLSGAGVAVLAAVATLLFWGHARRRLRAMDWSGWWLWVLPVPLLSLGLISVMLLRRTRAGATPGRYNRAGQSGVWTLCLLIASRVAWAPYVIPTGSMSPTLHPGDYVIATRVLAAPDRGDIIVFAHPVNGLDFLKRVIALPGDRVELRDGRVILNGRPLPQAPAPEWTEPYRATVTGTRPRCLAPVPEGAPCAKHAARETLPGGPTYTVLDVASQPLDTTAPITVPEGHIFVLGDNRDNSLDSRSTQALGGPGLVPLANVAGRVRLVLYSQEGRPGRLLRRIE